MHMPSGDDRGLRPASMQHVVDGGGWGIMKWLGTAADARASVGGAHDIYLMRMRTQSWRHAAAGWGAAQQDRGQEPRMQSIDSSRHRADVSSPAGGGAAPPHQPRSARCATRGRPPAAPEMAVQRQRRRQRLAGCYSRRLAGDGPLGGQLAAAPHRLPCWRLRCCHCASSRPGCRVRCHRHRARALLSWRRLHSRSPCTLQQPARLLLPVAPNSHHQTRLAAARRRAPAQ